MDPSQEGERTAVSAGLDLYRALFRGSSDGLVLADPGSARVQDANAAASLMAGRPPDAMRGLSLLDLAESQDARRLEEAIETALRTGSARLDFTLSRPDRDASRPVAAHFERVSLGLLVVLHDVAEKAKLLEMVRRERAMTRGLLETVNACVLEVDASGRAHLFNRRFRETTGLALSEVLGRDAFEALVAERDRPTARRALQAVLAGERVEDLDLAVTSGRILSFNAALLEDADRKPRGAVWVALDVTDTRRLVDQVRRREERSQRSLQQLKEFSRVSSMILQERDLDRTCRMFVEAIRDVSTFNRAILTLCDDEFRGYQWYFAGLSEEEITTFHQNKLTSRERVTIFQERFRLGNSYYIPHDAGWQYEGVRSHQDLDQMVDWHPDDFLFIPLYGSNRKIVGIVSVDDPADGHRPSAESISPLELFANQVAHAIEEKKLDREVKKTTRRYQTLVETMNDGLVTVDLRERITFVNPALTALLGYRSHELMDRPLSQVTSPEMLEVFRRRTRLHEGGAVSRFELALVASGGDPIPVMISATPYLQDNAMVGCFAIVGDLRDQKKAEEERRRMHEEVLEANAKLRESMEKLQATQQQLIQAEKLSAIGELISGVAHELNNPLTGVMGYSQLLMSTQASPEIKKNLERINKEAVRCQKIVQNLLAFARRHHPERKLVNINEVVRNTVDLREYQLKVDNVEILTDLQDDLPSVLADAYQIQQVFVNIINNAHQAMVDGHMGGRLAVRSRSAGGMVRVAFIDNGPGIPKDRIGRIFDPFFTTKGIGKGTGLGLSLSYGIVQEHDGRILVESEPGQGATFVVELPADAEGTQVSEQKQSGEEAPLPAPQRGSVLVVDDEETILELLLALLQAGGHAVDTAGNGREALDKIQHSDFDVIISDVKMPDMGGQRLYEAISRIKPHLLPRMIFSTGDTVNPSTQAFFQRTGSPCLSKPFKLEEVEQLVGRILSRR